MFVPGSIRRDRAVEAVDHPDGAGAGRNPARAVANWNRLDDGGCFRVDARNRVAVGVGDPIRAFAGRDGRGCRADAGVSDKATRARVDDAQRVVGRRDGRAASSSTLIECNERNHHSGGDHACDDDAGREPPMPAAASRRNSGGLFLELCGRRRFQRLFSKGRRGQKLAVDRFGLGRGVRPKLLCEQPPAPFVDLECLGPVARGRVRLHQPPVAALAKRLEGDGLLGPFGRIRGIAEAEAGHAEDLQRPGLEVADFAPLLLHPDAVVARQERLTHE